MPLSRSRQETNGAAQRGALRLAVAVLAVAALGSALAACSSTPTSQPVGYVASRHSPPPPTDTSYVVGPISAPGGPFMYDRFGRVVILHGVNAVEKRAPYELVPAPGKPWNFSAADARRMAGLGFDIVRLGIIWQGLEPGHGSMNDPATCAPGPPGHPHEYNQAIVDAYLARLDRTVQILADYGIFSLIDMHQDVYSPIFEGEGAPAWAVCTDGIKPATIPGRWSNNYAQPAVQAAYQNFFTNDVVGNLQGQYDRVWSAVAGYFRNDPWVIGYDPFNEPTEGVSTAIDNAPFDELLQCFYAGKANPGTVNSAAIAESPPTDGEIAGQAPSCPADDPAQGVIAAIENADPNHLVFPETDIDSNGVPTYVGPMPYPRLVLNFHNYCVFRLDNGDIEPGKSSACAKLEKLTFTRRAAERAADATPEQPGGPAWFMSEFGATNSISDLTRMTAYADQSLLGWTYWMWKYYDDPTGSVNEPLVGSNGKLLPKAKVLSQTYAQAIAGTPTYMSFDPTTGLFELRYVANDAVKAPTVVYVALSEHYPHGYCAAVSGGRVLSAGGAERLLVANDPGAGEVSVRITSGTC